MSLIFNAPATEYRMIVGMHLINLALTLVSPIKAWHYAPPSVQVPRYFYDLVNSSLGLGRNHHQPAVPPSHIGNSGTLAVSAKDSTSNMSGVG